MANDWATGYILAQSAANADAAVAAERAHTQAAMGAAFAAEGMRAELTPQILDLKKRLVAVRVIRDTLRKAMKEVAPDHPLINPEFDAQNPLLRPLAEEAMAKVKRWDDPV